MNYRNAVLLAAKTGLTTATETIEISVKDPISRIQVLVYATNGDSVPDGHPAALISKLEIVDGSEVICSLEGRQAQAMSYYDIGKLDQNGIYYETGRAGWATLSLNFGRYLYDELLALNPANFRNLQLRVQYAIASGLSSIASLGIKVMADLFDEKVVSPIGYLLSKEEFKFTPASGSVKYIELPVDMPIRKLVVISPSSSADISSQAGAPKVDEEDGKRTLFDLGSADMKRWYQQIYGEIIEAIHAIALTGGEEVFITQGSNILVAGMNTGSAGGDLYHSISAGLGQTFTSVGNNAGFQAVITGCCPHGSYPILFGKQNEIEDWWDVSRVGKARLQLTPTSSVDTGTDVSVLTQRLARY